MKLELDLEKFNLHAFLEDSERNGEGIMTPTVQMIENLEDCWSDEIDVEPAEYHIDKLVNHHKYLYVNFSEPGIYREIKCIDGQTYYLINQDDYERENEDEDDFPDDIKPVIKLHISESESIGYLFEYPNGKLIIKSAIYYLHGKNFVGPSGSTTEIDVEDDVEIFELPMMEYLNKYIIK